MNGLLRYDPVIIQQAVTDCKTFVDRVEGLVEDAKAAVNARMQVAEGAYQEAFVAAQARWDTAVTNIKVVTGNFAGALARADETMSATDRRWASNMDAIG